MSISRRRTREFLLQSLYARIQLGPSFRRDFFMDSYFEQENIESFDLPYLDTMQELIISHEHELLAYIMRLAPKFEIETMPVMHVLILMISLSEMLYFTVEVIPEKVSVNEAIELAKKFSDHNGKGLVNGALSTFLRERDTLKNTLPEHTHILFS